MINFRYQAKKEYTGSSQTRPVTMSFLHSILPGHIYGHLNVWHGRIGEEKKLYAISVNRKSSAQPSDSVLFSLGGRVTDSDDDGMTYSQQFEYKGTDTKSGSSGAPIFARGQNKVIGVHSSGYSGLFGAWNKGSWITPKVERYNQAPPIRSILGNRVTASSRWIGAIGTSTENSNLHCPSRYLAAGIISTKTTHGFVGNFGLICIPYWDGRTNFQLDRAVVIAGGSSNAGPSTDGTDFNTYLREHLNTRFATPRMQNFTMCRPGYYLRGVFTTAELRVSRVFSIRCSKFHQATSTKGLEYYTTTHQPRISIGNRSIGYNRRTDCPLGQVVSGMRITATDLGTMGFKFYCKRVVRN